ncbi:MAG: c-type cytochrome [Lunatimonas sp.]|uniref:cbb3-type cytochrome c oxidase N-terminal domain-containing protein n=1 Tax=Lunatimonas sp. TaxID=2060141 RepID=UPI00263BC83B|nr:cbb3-type cytochrome c oxidase N-terminal domain-containing protein [Lunatimonas sp.]MCC5939390.1 c-type cytochrome [Lunatimonas sp.]
MKMFRSLMLLVAGLFTGIPAFAQESEISFVKEFASMSSSETTLLIVMGVILLVIVILMILLIYLVTFLKQVLQLDNPALAAEPSWWEQFNERYVTGKVKPIEEEKNLMLDHSYDGIVELDNFMPPWLKYLFYVTIVFGVVYVLNYSVFGIGKTQIEEYEQELYVAQLEAEARQALAVSVIDETNVQFDATGPSLKAGQTIYENNCVACHAIDGGGGVGPNLTDEYWIHGGSIEDVFKVVKYGVIEKGMIPWQDQLSPEEMQQVSSYILTLVGTTPANPKAPQGDKYEQKIEEPIDALTEDELGVEEV